MAGDADIQRELDDDLEHGRRKVAEIRREVWPDYGGDWPEESASDEDLNSYIEALEAAVVGQASAMRLIARSLRT